MPLFRKPNQGEKEDEYISACMANDIMNKEFPDQKQRAGVCYSQWRDKEYTKFVENQTYDINDVEIFASGTWNKDKYTNNDLDDMVSSFPELKVNLKPCLKLGHDKDQKLLQKDGYPAIGWVVNLKRKGNTLLADFKGIPKKIKELIDKKAYGRFSSEFYWNLKIDNKKYRRVLKAVALLGIDVPAVDLDDFINLYIEDNLEQESLKIYNENNFNYENLKIYNNLESEMDEQIVKTLQDDIKTYKENEKTFESEIKTYKEQIDQLTFDKKELEGTIKELTEKIEKTEEEQKENEIKKFINEQVKETKILPSQIEKYTKLAGQDFESVKELIKDMPKHVNIDEESHNTEKPKEYSKMTNEDKDEYLAAEVQKYAEENKISYKDAYGIVLKKLEE